MSFVESSPLTVPMDTPSDHGIEPLSGPWLLLAEMNHRVANEYALAVASLRLAARRAAPDAGAALTAACDRLHAHAEAHRAHLAPAGDRTDLSDYLARLCLSLVRASLAERGVSLRFIAETCELPSEACWRIGLIVSELVTNALRHGVSGPGGKITVQVCACGGQVDCIVRDNGCGAASSPPGQGTSIVTGIADELGGRIVRSFGPLGCCVTLSLRTDAVAGWDRAGAPRRGFRSNERRTAQA